MPHLALSKLDHRPWNIPERPWTWRQSWCDLLFAHWPVPSAMLRRFVPPSLTLQEFDGSAWIGVVPFRMEGVMRRPLPDLPWVSAFPELNVRTYVEHGGKPGVWFLSLDATNALAVWAARRFFHLPYYRAAMTLTPNGDKFRYASARRGAEFRGSYGPSSEPYYAKPGSLEHFLTERYCLYAKAPNGAILRNDVQHHPWALQRAWAELEHNTMLDFHGLDVREPPALLHFAKRIDVVVWNAERVE
jgi:uncharacterized protein YqjF (DUF2071 family)